MNGLGKLGGGLAVLAGESAADAKVCGRRVLTDRSARGSGAERKNERVCARPRRRASTHALLGADSGLFSARSPQLPAQGLAPSPRGARKRG